MFYISKALFDVMTEKQQKELMGVYRDIYSNIPRSTQYNSYNELYIKTAREAVRIPKTIQFIDIDGGSHYIYDYSEIKEHSWEPET